jgi:hypothetical protein
MKTSFHPQSILIGAVFSAALMMFILPSFGQHRDRDGRGFDRFDPAHVDERFGGEPVTVVVENGRYQVATSDRVAYVVDTLTGEVWKDRDMSDRSYSAPGFFDIKLNHRH